MEEETKFHWSEGMKFVVEGLKGIIILNGAASVSMLTFIGNTKVASGHLILGLLSYALGAMTGPIAFCFAYLAQLQYGNATRLAGNRWLASLFHRCTYGSVLFGLLAFVVGTVLVASGLWGALPLQTVTP